MSSTTPYISRKIQGMYSILIFMVIFAHSSYAEAANYHFAYMVQQFVGGLCFVANALFFAISGYLFFNKVNAIVDCRPKIVKRLKTLLIPYLIWNLIFVLWYVVLKITPGASSYTNSDMLTKVFGGGFLKALYELFIVPAGFHLWFLRDLIIYVLISPILYLALKHLGKWIPIALFVLSSIGTIFLPSTIKLWGLFFFVLGGFFSMSPLVSRISEINTSYKRLITLISSILFLSYFVGHSFISISGIYVGIMLCGAIAIWNLYDILLEKRVLSFAYPLIKWTFGYSFFVYLFHEPAFNIIKKLGLTIFGVSESSLILLYFINPVIMFFVSVALARLMKNYTPSFYKILVGGR